MPVLSMFLIQAFALCQLAGLVVVDSLSKYIIINCKKLRLIHYFVEIMVEIADCLTIGSLKLNN